MKRLLLLLLLTCILWACNSKPQPEAAVLIPCQDVYTIAAEGGSLYLAFVTNQDYLIQTQDDWLSWAPDSKSVAKETAVLIVQENLSGAERQAQVTIVTPEAKETVTVVQAAYAEPDPQEEPVLEFILGNGYAGTSVNVAVFRAASIVSDGNRQFASWYDASGVINIARRKINPDGPWETLATTLKGAVADAHNIISLGLDGDGYLHVSWNQHGTRLRYARSKTPYEVDFEVLDEMIDASAEKNVTYPEFRRFSNGDLLFAYRDGVSGSGNLVLNRYAIATRKWSRVQDNLLSGEGSRNAYWQMYMDAADVIYLSWVWRETGDVATNHDLCYAVSRDGGVSWQRSNGTRYTLPITVDNAEVAWPVPQKSEMINQTSMTADAAGHPYIATYWRSQGESVPQYRLVYLDGSAWRCVQVGERISSFSLSGIGTKAIPMSRPQIVSDGRRTMMIFRDIDRGRRVSLAYSEDLATWQVRD